MWLVTFCFYCSILSAVAQPKMQANSTESACRLVHFMDLVFIRDSQLIPFKDTNTITIFYFADYTLYRLTPKRRMETNERIYGSEAFFLYKEPDLHGFWFDDLHDSIAIRLPVDSILFARGFKPKVHELKTDTSLEYTDERLADTLIEKYSYKLAGDEEYPDSLWVYYSKKMISLRYTFSRDFDESRKSKLFKIQNIFSAKYSNKYKFHIPRREFTLTLEEENVIDSTVRDFAYKMICRIYNFDININKRVSSFNADLNK